MADRNSEERFDDPRRATGADTGREGYGDEGGARVGRPDAGRGADAGTGPSSQPVKEGLEGAAFEGDEGSTGAGSEAAQGIHDAKDAKRGAEGGASRAGSEPLVNREQEHKSGYGGEGGAPRTSSDQRE